MRDPEKILADDPGSVVFSRYAEQLAREGRVEQAVDVLKRGIQANPFHAPGYSLLAELLFQLESEEAAVENIMSALRLDPQMPRDLFRLGTHYLDSDPSRALPLLKAAHAYAPESGEVASSFESARLMVESSGGLEDIPPVADDGRPDGDEWSADGGFDELEDASLSGDDLRNMLRKPFDVSDREDRDFLALMGEQDGGTIQDELDSLFQSLETGEERTSIPREFAPGATAFGAVSVSADASDGGKKSDVKPDVPESGEENADEESDIEPPAYERPFNERPLESLNEDDLNSDDAVPQEFYDTQLVEEVEEKKDFFNAITEYGDEKDEDDLDTLFESLSKDRNMEVPLPEREESELEGLDAERKDSDVGSEPGPEELPEGGLDEAPGEVLPEGYGIVDLEKEAEAGKVLEITDEEEYDLSRFGFESVPEDAPVLSEAERSELLAMTAPQDEESGSAEAEETDSGNEDLPPEDLEKPEKSDEDEQTVESAAGGSQGSSSAPGTPVSAAPVTEIEAGELTGDGVDYSDILSAWKLPGEESAPLSPIGPESFSLTDIFDATAEGNPDASPSLSAPTTNELENPVIRKLFERGVELETPEQGDPEVQAFSLSAPDEDDSPWGKGEDEAPVSGEGTDAFALPMMEGLFDMGSPFPDLTEEQTALIDDFVSGKEPESNIPEEALPVTVLANRETALDPEALPGGDGDRIADPESNDLLPEPEYLVDPGEFTLTDEPEEYRSNPEEREPSIPVATENDVSAVALADVEPVVIEVPVKPAARAGGVESLDDLISLYEDMLDKPVAPSPRVLRSITPSPVTDAPPVVEPKPDPVREGEPKPRASKPLGNYTATMAEIYVSQGLITRAMEIYTVLAEDNPGNGQYRLRLAELKKMHDQQPDIS